MLVTVNGIKSVWEESERDTEKYRGEYLLGVMNSIYGLACCNIIACRFGMYIMKWMEWRGIKFHREYTR